MISGAKGDDALIITNKVIVAEQFTALMDSLNITFTIDAAKTAITGVTALASSVTTALEAFDEIITPPVVTPPPVMDNTPPPPPPEPMTLPAPAMVILSSAAKAPCNPPLRP